MERVWKVANLFVGLVLIGLCSGFPIGLENSAADYHTQFLTGLVGVLLTVCGVVFLAGCLCCQRKNGFKEFHNNPVVASSTSSLDHGHINPIANGEFTIFTPLSPSVHNNNVFLANEQIVGQTEIDYNHAEFDVRSWFDGTETDFPRTRLKYIKELGKGWFGRVVEGTAQISNSGDEKQNWKPVAVRILEASATSSERAVFLHDAAIYRCGTHPHILQLLGRSLESVPLLLLQELCPRGDLKKYLRDNRGTAEKLLSSELPLLWCCQLSSALKHLHDHRLTHPDLAARNCQVVTDLSIKLGDYGLAASLYPEDYYEGAPAVPVRWCAPESLIYTSTTIQPKQITFEGNVWSLGVTMWEIYDCGGQPYANLSDDDVLSQVLGSANLRLAKPNVSVLYTDYIFRLMQLCWSTSESRPSVSQVHLMLTDLMQVYQNTKHITHSEPLISMQDFDRRWDTFKPNTVAKTDNHEPTQECISMADIDLSDITILNLNLNKDEELLNTKSMSPSLNNLHGSLDNLASGEMDSWLQKVATKTGDMSYVRGLSEAIKDLDNALALENISSSDSSHQPSPAPENLPNLKNKLEFKLGPTTSATANDFNKTQNSSLTESMQRTSSESETEDENWRRKIECGAYSEKVHQKSKSVTDLMVLTHIDCSESDSETPLPSLDYRINYKNVRYAPKQNLENASLMFGSEGNLLSVHDKFQEELKRLQEERKDSLLFVPESIRHNDETPNTQNKSRISESVRSTDNSSSDEETWTVRKSEDAAYRYVNRNPSTNIEEPANLNLNKNTVSPNHRNPETLIEELSSPADIQPAEQVYNIFNVTVDANFSPMHLKSNLQDIICFKDPESDTNVEAVNKTFSESRCFHVPKLTELIQSNDDLMDYIITRYDAQEDAKPTNPEINVNISESKSNDPGRELNNNVQNSTVDILPSSSKSVDSVHTVTQNFLQNEQQNYDMYPKVHFDISQTQDEVSPSSMTHSSVFTSTPFRSRSLKSFDTENRGETMQFSSNFDDLNKEEDGKTEMKFSLDTWDNFLEEALDGSREYGEFDSYSTEPRSLLFGDKDEPLNEDTIECKNEALIKSLTLTNEKDLGLENDMNITVLKQNVNVGENELENVEDATFVAEQVLNKTFVCEGSDADINNVIVASQKNEQVDEEVVNNKTIVLTEKNEQLQTIYTKENGGSNTENVINDETIIINAKQEDLDSTYTKETAGGSKWEPGEGWFLHPQTNSEVSGQIEVSQGTEESYVGFGMDDEIMAAIRNELLMKLPQAQGQSSEQVRDTDEWDTEGRSEVLIKYNVYTTPLSPIPEESYSENDSYHLIYNRENSSDSENEDWPEPYEEHNSGMADTESRSMQIAESPIPEPQNRHTPSQDSCCSNDTLFNLEELTFIANENEKVHGDLFEKKGCDFAESDKKSAVLDKDVEESTLRVEEQTEIKRDLEQNHIREVNKNFLEIEVKKAQEEMQQASRMPNNPEERASKNANNFKTAIFTCSIESTNPAEAFGEVYEELNKTGIEGKINDTINSVHEENPFAIEERNETFCEAYQAHNEPGLEGKNNDTINSVHEENVSGEENPFAIEKPNETFGEVYEEHNEPGLEGKNDDTTNSVHEENVSGEENPFTIEKHCQTSGEVMDDSKKDTEATFKTDSETFFTEPAATRNKMGNNDSGFVEAINKNVNIGNWQKTQDEEMNMLNFSHEYSDIAFTEADDTKAVENSGNCCIDIEGKNMLNLGVNEVSPLKHEDCVEENSDQKETLQKDIPNIISSEVSVKTNELNVSEVEHILSNDPCGEIFKHDSGNEENLETVEFLKQKNWDEMETSLERIESPQQINWDEVTKSVDVTKVEDDTVVIDIIQNGNVENHKPSEIELQTEIFSLHGEPDFANNFVKNSVKVQSEIIDKNEIIREQTSDCDERKTDIQDISTTIKNNLDNIDNDVDDTENCEDGEHCEADMKNEVINLVGDSLYNTISAIDLKTENVLEVQDDVSSHVNGIDVEGESDKKTVKSLTELEVHRKHKSDELCQPDVNKVPIDIAEKENEEERVDHTKCEGVNREIEESVNKNESTIVDERQPDKYIKEDETHIESVLNFGNNVDVCINPLFENTRILEKEDVIDQNKDRTYEDKTFQDTSQNGSKNINSQLGIVQNGYDSDTVDLENFNVGFIKRENQLTKTDDSVTKNDGVEINKLIEVEDVDLKENDVNTLNKKNIQNGTMLENPTKWINENDSDLMDVFVSSKTSSSSVKEISQPDSADISLIVENNPNYITEFLNHERHSSSTRLDTLNADVPAYVNIPMQNNQNVGNSANNDYVNVDDISLKLIEHRQITESPSNINASEIANIVSDLNTQPEYVNVVQHENAEEHLYDPVAGEEVGDMDIYDALSDIRFTGPTDIQLMSTSFSESADIDEQDWDSGSDTRSSSSGEFIWKEGEHEESVKALRAAPQDVIATEKVTPMEDIEEVSTESSEDEDGDSPEFVPSAWDKYATPTKSALRSPEKTLEKSEVKIKKPKGVWFKKQKYHCVYEYPREPESPNVNSFDLWQPAPLLNWEADTNPYVPIFDGANPHPECYQQLGNQTKNLYQIPDFNSGMTALDDEFFISSTARPFESFGGLSSQFFPGQSTSSDQWMDLSKQSIENITPDSGVEDITPSNVDGNEFLQAPPKHQVQQLKILAAVVLKNNQIAELKSNSKDALGGLRHARNKLKLDLPPSPSAFTSTKAFTIEPPEEPVTKREVPTFTTFGKSRFLVQHVDTPTCDEENQSKNVSFEALPYKPAQVKEDKTKIEVVRGEASLLDSADEDSGIESSTLERKKITNVAD